MDKGGTMIERVRAVLVTPDDCLLAIRRDRPDRATYWVLPGGHVDPEDQNIEAALSREISEEIAGEARAAICSRYRTCDPPRPRKYLAGPEGQRSRTTVSVRKGRYISRTDRGASRAASPTTP